MVPIVADFGLVLTQRPSKIGASRSHLLNPGPLTCRFPPPEPNRSTLGLMATWEMTITCHDGTRLRLSEWRDPAPQKGEVVETLDTGQTIKARINSWREEKVGGSRPPLFQVTATEI